MDSDIMKLIIGLGGIALSGGVGKLVYDWIHGRVMKEESAVTQWQGIARSRLDEIHKLKARLAWFETHYALLWLAYSRLPPPDKEAFPFAPPPPPNEAGNDKT